MCFPLKELDLGYGSVRKKEKDDRETVEQLNWEKTDKDKPLPSGDSVRVEAWWWAGVVEWMYGSSHSHCCYCAPEVLRHILDAGVILLPDQLCETHSLIMFSRLVVY